MKSTRSNRSNLTILFIVLLMFCWVSNKVKRIEFLTVLHFRLSSHSSHCPWPSAMRSTPTTTTANRSSSGWSDNPRGTPPPNPVTASLPTTTLSGWWRTTTQGTTTDTRKAGRTSRHRLANLVPATKY